MKYDLQLSELKNILPTAKNILIAMPANANIDILASGLSLFLTLQANGKQASIVCDDTIKVGQSYLFAIDHVGKTLPSTDGGNLTLTLEGVAASDNTIPALEKLDWYAENSNLNLVFHVLAGQTFNPAKIVPKLSGGGFNLIFTVGAVNLNALGNIYTANTQAFSGTHVVNIDTQSSNTSFGQTNILDSASSSVSEVMSNLLIDLGFSLSADCASNLIAVIFDATLNLTNEKASAETYMAVANCLRVGGRKPIVSAPISSSYDWNALMPASPNKSEPKETPPQSTVSTQPAISSVPVSNIPEYAMPSVVPANSKTPINQVIDNSGDDSITVNQPASLAGGQDEPSPEERPYDEGVISETVEPEWLTPKIFKGTSLS